MPVVPDGAEAVLIDIPGRGNIAQTLPLPGGLSPEAWVKRMAASGSVPAGSRWTVATLNRGSGGYTPKRRWRPVRP